VTYHDAFPYFARRYGLKIAGVIEETPGVGPTSKELAALGQVIQRENVRVIFAEQRHSQKLANRLANDFKLPVARLDTLESGPREARAFEDGLRRNAAVLAEILK
jgi:ABC-type Zn uptake system ZnuABC Zn-binding protein ZnuA